MAAMFAPPPPLPAAVKLALLVTLPGICLPCPVAAAVTAAGPRLVLPTKGESTKEPGPRKGLSGEVQDGLRGVRSTEGLNLLGSCPVPRAAWRLVDVEVGAGTLGSHSAFQCLDVMEVKADVMEEVKEGMVLALQGPG